jgi:hypothetical protein
MKVYKVVIKEKRNFVSAVMYIHSNWKTTYRLGKTTVPKEGRLFAFKNFKDAYDWVANGSRWYTKHVSILECEAEGVSLSPILYQWNCPIVFSNYWEQYEEAIRNHKKKPKCNVYIPTGTIMCRAITPMKIVAERRPVKGVIKPWKLSEEFKKIIDSP